MIRVEECPDLSYKLYNLVFLFFIHTVPLPLWWVHSLPLSPVAPLSLPSSYSILFHLFLSFLLTFLILSHCYACLFIGGFGHKLFCWLNICSLIGYPFSPSRFPSISSSLPPSLPLSRLNPYSNWISKPLSTLLFCSFSLLCLISFQTFASQWPYIGTVLSCPANIRWCPGLLTPYYWAELDILQKPTIHIIPTAQGGYNFYYVSPLCLPRLCWLRPRLIHRQYFLIELWF